MTYQSEVDRLREEVRTAPQWVRTYWREKCEQAEARTRALEAALRMCRRLIDIAETTGNGKYLQQAEAFIDAALTEPTPPQEEK